MKQNKKYYIIFRLGKICAEWAIFCSVERQYVMTQL